MWLRIAVHLVVPVPWHEKDLCWGLRVWAPANSHVGILTPKIVMTFQVTKTLKLLGRGQAEAESLSLQNCLL